MSLSLSLPLSEELDNWSSDSLEIDMTVLSYDSVMSGGGV
jgi:hypothetical protein